VLVTYNYIYAVALSSNKSMSDQIFLQAVYITSQYVFHFVYFFFLFTEWNVVNRQMYWRQLKTLWTPVLIAFHMFLFTLLQNDVFILAPFISFYMGIYWKIHLRLLENINTELNNIERE
jgi:hypothetical protein